MRVMRTALLLASLLMATTASAGPIFSFDTPGNSFTNGSWKFALNFEVLNPITVSGLGYYADPFTGSVDNNAVALYDSAQNLLASVIVTNEYDVFDYFRYVTIAEMILGPGVYQVVGVSQSDNYTWDNVNHTFDPNIAYVSNSWVQDFNGIASYVSGTQIDTEFGFSGPNVFIGAPTFTDPDSRAVPAPASWLLLGLGMAALLMRRKA
jgi:hypothetical protein